ncbi:CsbD family protein [Methylobacterium aquaticum]|uniref:General stress protein CsbD n=1 Tax=Methylobacterium aquaticum TaxID=270351 RepID=A0A0J6S9Z3_9HYPH|nr:CsbD family protein [Methylobacterium aquaticum]KMO30517.1 general stress protein CsbD [Methylobacterium aquaticum]
MNRDQFNGASRHLKGRAQTALGGLTGDPVRQVRGAANQVAGGAQYAYGRARDRADDLVEDGRHLAREVRERAGEIGHTARERAEDVADAARAARRRGEAYGQRAVRYAEGHRTNTLIGIAVLAFAAGWLVRQSR